MLILYNVDNLGLFVKTIVGAMYYLRMCFLQVADFATNLRLKKFMQMGMARQVNEACFTKLKAK